MAVLSGFSRERDATDSSISRATKVLGRVLRSVNRFYGANATSLSEQMIISDLTSRPNRAIDQDIFSGERLGPRWVLSEVLSSVCLPILHTR